MWNAVICWNLRRGDWNCYPIQLLIEIIVHTFMDLKVAHNWMLSPLTLRWNILKSGKTPPSSTRSVLLQFQYKIRTFKINCYSPEWTTFDKISEIRAQQIRRLKMNNPGFIQLLGNAISANSDVAVTCRWHFYFVRIGKGIDTVWMIWKPL